MEHIDSAIKLAKACGYPTYLTTTEAAAFLRRSPEWLHLQRKNAVGPKFSKLGKARNSHIVYSLIDLVHYVESSMVRTA